MIRNTMITLAVLSLFSACSNKVEKPEEAGKNNSIEYLCKEGEKLTISHLSVKENTDHILLQVEGRQYKLKRVRSASGEKYSNGKQTWWTKGSSGFLEIDDNITIKNCMSQNLSK